MTALLLSMLFASSAVFACAAIMGSWREYGASALSLSRQLQECTDQRECRYTITTVEVRPSAAMVYRPDFTAGARRPLHEVALRAAA